MEKQLVFLGIVRDFTNTRNYKILYKKSVLATNGEKLSVEFMKSSLVDFKDNLEAKIAKNGDKVLKSIILEEKEEELENNYYLVFENTSFDLDSLILEVRKGNKEDEIFVTDVTKKLNDFLTTVKD